MYKVLQYVWDLPSYQPSVELLTSEAVQYDGKEQEIPPLLRFINMIINDATIQLDEGLEVWNMDACEYERMELWVFMCAEFGANWRATEREKVWGMAII